jgi:DNA-binding winged helix-turn-helix (wHTH) protein
MNGHRNVQPGDVLSFGPFSLFVGGRLLKSDETITLGGRALDVLIALTERAGEIVSYSELISLAWPSVTVDEANLRVQITALRRAFGEEKGARYISNVTGRGYCFVAPVSRSTGRLTVAEGVADGEQPRKLSPRLARMVGREEAVRAVSEQLATGACRENEHAALSKGITIHTVSSDATVLSNGLLLGAALRNLVSNAVKYTRPGGRILVGCRRTGSEIRIDVYDNGIGISDEQIPRIFEAFTRLDAAQSGGLGIGLFIVRQALGILGHRIDVASTPCRGSRFSIFVARSEGGTNETLRRSRRMIGRRWKRDSAPCRSWP